jgi:hypothetical protein
MSVLYEAEHYCKFLDTNWSANNHTFHSSFNCPVLPGQGCASFPTIPMSTDRFFIGIQECGCHLFDCHFGHRSEVIRP